MLRHFFRSERTHLDDEIHAVAARMQIVGVESDEYPKLMTYLEKLHKLKAGDRRAPVKLDTIVTTGGTVLVAFLLIAYEQKHVITSKALPFLRMTTPSNN
jgi:hypothetical protein